MFMHLLGLDLHLEAVYNNWPNLEETPTIILDGPQEVSCKFAVEMVMTSSLHRTSTTLLSKTGLNIIHH